MNFSLSSAAGSRVMMLPGCSCETGIQGTNPGRIKDVNGRRIGKMYSWCPGIWAFLVEWYVRDDITHASYYMFIAALKGRSHEGLLEQRVPAFAQSMGSW